MNTIFLMAHLLCNSTWGRGNNKPHPHTSESVCLMKPRSHLPRSERSVKAVRIKCTVWNNGKRGREA